MKKKKKKKRRKRKKKEEESFLGGFEPGPPEWNYISI